MHRSDTRASAGESNASLKGVIVTSSLRPPPVVAKPRKLGGSTTSSLAPVSSSGSAAPPKNKKETVGGKKVGGMGSRAASTAARNGAGGGGGGSTTPSSSVSTSLNEKNSTIRELLPQRLNSVFTLPNFASRSERRASINGGGGTLSSSAPPFVHGSQKSFTSTSGSPPASSRKVGSTSPATTMPSRGGGSGMGVPVGEDSIEELFRQLRTACAGSSATGVYSPNGTMGPTAAFSSSSSPVSSSRNSCGTTIAAHSGNPPAGRPQTRRTFNRGGGSGMDGDTSRGRHSTLPVIVTHSQDAAPPKGNIHPTMGSTSSSSSTGYSSDGNKGGEKRARKQRKSLSNASTATVIGDGGSGMRSSEGNKKGLDGRHTAPPDYSPSRQKESRAPSFPTTSTVPTTTSTSSTPVLGMGTSPGSHFFSSSVSSAVPDASIASLSTSAEAERVTYQILFIQWLLFPSTFLVEDTGMLRETDSGGNASFRFSSAPSGAKDGPAQGCNEKRSHLLQEHAPSLEDSNTDNGYGASSGRGPRQGNLAASPTTTTSSEPFRYPLPSSSAFLPNTSSASMTNTSKRAWKTILQKPRSIFPLVIAAARADLLTHDMGVAACLLTLLYNMLRSIPAEQQKKVVRLCVKLGLHRVCTSVLHVCSSCSNSGTLLRTHDIGLHTSSAVVSPGLASHTTPANHNSISFQPFVSSTASDGGSLGNSSSSSATRGATRLRVAARVCEAAALLVALTTLNNPKMAMITRSSGALLSLSQAVETYGGVLEHRLTQHHSLADFCCSSSRPASTRGDGKGGARGGGGVASLSLTPHLPHGRGSSRPGSHRSSEVGGHAAGALSSLHGLMGKGGGGVGGEEKEQRRKETEEQPNWQEKKFTLLAIKRFLEKTEWLLQCFVRLLLTLHLVSKSSANVQVLCAPSIASSSPSFSSPMTVTVTTKVFTALSFFLTHVAPKLLHLVAFTDLNHLLLLSPHVESLSHHGQYVASFVMQGIRLCELTLFWSLALVRRVCGEDACAERAIGEVHSQHLLRTLFKLVKHLAVMRDPPMEERPFAEGRGKERAALGEEDTGVYHTPITASTPTRRGEEPESSPLCAPPSSMEYKGSLSQDAPETSPGRRLPSPSLSSPASPFRPSSTGGRAHAIPGTTMETSGNEFLGRTFSSPPPSLPSPSSSSSSSSLLRPPSPLLSPQPSRRVGQPYAIGCTPPYAARSNVMKASGETSASFPVASSSSSSVTQYAFLCIRHPKFVNLALHTFGIVLNGYDRARGIRTLAEGGGGSIKDLVEYVLRIPESDPTEWLQRYHHLCEIFGICFLPSFQTSFPLSCSSSPSSLSVPMRAATLPASPGMSATAVRSRNGESHVSRPPTHGTPGVRRRPSAVISSTFSPITQGEQSSRSISPASFSMATLRLPDSSPLFDPSLNLRLPTPFFQEMVGIPVEERGGTPGGVASSSLVPQGVRDGNAPCTADRPEGWTTSTVPSSPAATPSGRRETVEGRERAAPRRSTAKGVEELEVSLPSSVSRDAPNTAETALAGSTESTFPSSGMGTAFSSSSSSGGSAPHSLWSRGGGLLLVDTHPLLFFPELLGGEVDPMTRLPAMEATVMPWAFTEQPPPSTFLTMATLREEVGALFPTLKEAPSCVVGDTLPLTPSTPETITHILRHHIRRLMRVSQECSDFTRRRHAYAVVYERGDVIHPGFVFRPPEEEDEERAGEELEEGKPRKKPGRDVKTPMNGMYLPSPPRVGGGKGENDSSDPGTKRRSTSSSSAAAWRKGSAGSGGSLARECKEGRPSTSTTSSRTPIPLLPVSSGALYLSCSPSETECSAHAPPGLSSPPTLPTATMTTTEESHLTLDTVVPGTGEQRGAMEGAVAASAAAAVLPSFPRVPSPSTASTETPLPFRSFGSPTEDTATRQTSPLPTVSSTSFSSTSLPPAALPRHPSLSSKTTPPMPKSRPPKTLIFGSNFESGNLQRAILIAPDEYDLILSFDTCTNSFVQWFCFSITHYTPGHTYRFNILNMEKSSSTFNEGQRPLLLHIPLTAEEAEVARRRRVRAQAGKGGGRGLCTVVITAERKSSGVGATLYGSRDAPSSSSTAASGSHSSSSGGPAASTTPSPCWTRVGEEVYYFPNSFRRPGRENARKVFASNKSAPSVVGVWSGNTVVPSPPTGSPSSAGATSFSSSKGTTLPLVTGGAVNGGQAAASPATMAAAPPARGKGKRANPLRHLPLALRANSLRATPTTFTSHGPGVAPHCDRFPFAPGGTAEGVLAPTAEELLYDGALLQRESRYYTLTFTVTMPSTGGTVYLANCFPYTYTDLRRMLHLVSTARPSSCTGATSSPLPPPFMPSIATTATSGRPHASSHLSQGIPETALQETISTTEEHGGPLPSPGSLPVLSPFPFADVGSSTPASCPPCIGGGTSTLPSSSIFPSSPSSSSCGSSSCSLPWAGGGVSGESCSSFMVQQLCVSSGGLPIPLITATAMVHPTVHVRYTAEEIQRRPVCVMTARVHPGESNSSWMMHGILDFLAAGAREIHRRERAYRNGESPTRTTKTRETQRTSVKPSSSASSSASSSFTSTVTTSSSIGTAAVAVSLLQSFVFKIVPMINVDGVVMGNHRCSLVGVDLNRDYLRPSGDENPVLYALKSILSYMTGAGRRRVVVGADFHGHSRAKNFLLYGCTRETLIHSFKLGKRVPTDCFIDPATGQICVSVAPEKLFTAVLAQYCTAFDLCHSNFGVQKGKFNTNRVVLYREYGIRMCYGVEASMMGGRGAVSSYPVAAAAFMKPDSYYSSSSTAVPAEGGSSSISSTTMCGDEKGNEIPRGGVEDATGGGHSVASPWEWAVECNSATLSSSPASKLVETHYNEATFSAFGMAFLWSLHSLWKSERAYCYGRLSLPSDAGMGTGTRFTNVEDGASDVVREGGSGNRRSSLATSTTAGGKMEEGVYEHHLADACTESLAMKRAWLMVSQAGSGRQPPPGHCVLIPSSFSSALWEALPSNWNTGGGVNALLMPFLHRYGAGGGTSPMSGAMSVMMMSGSSGNSTNTANRLMYSGSGGGTSYSSQSVPLLLVPLFSPSCSLFTLPLPTVHAMPSVPSSFSSYGTTITGSSSSGGSTSLLYTPSISSLPSTSSNARNTSISFSMNTASSTTTSYPSPLSLWGTMCSLAFSHILPLSFHQRQQIMVALVHEPPLFVRLEECSMEGGGGGGEDEDDGDEDGVDEDDEGKAVGNEKRRKNRLSLAQGSGANPGGGGGLAKKKGKGRQREGTTTSLSERVDESDSDGESGESGAESEGEEDCHSHLRPANGMKREGLHEELNALEEEDSEEELLEEDDEDGDGDEEDERGNEVGVKEEEEDKPKND